MQFGKRNSLEIDGFRVPAGGAGFLFCRTCRPVLGPTKPPIQWEPEVFFRDLNRRSVKLRTAPFRIMGPTTVLPRYASMMWTGTNFAFYQVTGLQFTFYLMWRVWLSVIQTAIHVERAEIISAAMLTSLLLCGSRGEQQWQKKLDDEELDLIVGVSYCLFLIINLRWRYKSAFNG